METSVRNKSEIEADKKIVQKAISNAGKEGATKAEIVHATGFPKERVTDAIKRLGDKVERNGNGRATTYTKK